MALGAGIFFVVPLHFFGSTSTISRFGERFRDGQYTVWLDSCLLFFYSQWSRAQPFVKVGREPPVPLESAPLLLRISLRQASCNEMRLSDIRVA